MEHTGGARCQGHRGRWRPAKGPLSTGAIQDQAMRVHPVAQSHVPSAGQPINAHHPRTTTVLPAHASVDSVSADGSRHPPAARADARQRGGAHRDGPRSTARLPARTGRCRARARGRGSRGRGGRRRARAHPKKRATGRAARPSHTEMNTRNKRRLEALSRRYPAKLELRVPHGATPVNLRMQALTAARFDDILAHVTFTGTGSRDSRLYPLWDQTRIWDPGD